MDFMAFTFRIKASLHPAGNSRQTKGTLGMVCDDFTTEVLIPTETTEILIDFFSV